MIEEFTYIVLSSADGTDLGSSMPKAVFVPISKNLISSSKTKFYSALCCLSKLGSSFQLQSTNKISKK